MEKLLLVTPPFVQVNCPYPATAYLSGYLRRRGFDVAQADLSVELIGAVFSRDFLERVFELRIPDEDENLERIHAMRTRYTATIDAVVDFLRGRDPGLAQLICTGEFLPQAGRFETIGELSDLFGTLGTAECAKFLCTLYLQDLSDLIRATVTEHFEIVRYGERLAMAIGSFAEIETVLAEPRNPIEERMCELLERKITAERPTVVGFTIPFPGCLLAALRCAQYLKERHPDIRIAAGGGYPSTELRTMSDRGIFRYVDYLILDDGELPLERILSDGELVRTYTRDGYHEGEGNVTHRERGCPDFTGLPFDRYLSLLETTNPMHRLWTDGRWNKMTIAHGCYWAKCAFCDTSLDYIRRYESVPAATFVDWMEEVIRQTGSRSFHFTDEAAPPKLLKDLSLEILRRGLCVSWWTNVRFESRYTGDLCLLMAAAGCIAVSGGLEVASDRLLKKMNKGVDIAQAALAMRNFSYAGVMVHAYLMYGFPTQTLQESVDSLEVVRQMFRARLIDSAFWHRYAMTVHSPSGTDPEAFGVRRRNAHVHAFANNEVAFVENRGYDIRLVGEGLNEALRHYMAGDGLDRPVHKWFAGKTPRTAVDASLIADQMIRPDASRLFDENARVVWIGPPPVRQEDGLVLHAASSARKLKFKPHETEFLLCLIQTASDLSRKFTFGEAAELFRHYSEESFVAFYLSKKWDLMRPLGLLQI